MVVGGNRGSASSLSVGCPLRYSPSCSGSAPLHIHPRTPATPSRWGLLSSDAGIIVLMGDIEAGNTNAPGMGNTP